MSKKIFVRLLMTVVVIVILVIGYTINEKNKTIDSRIDNSIDMVSKYIDYTHYPEETVRFSPHFINNTHLELDEGVTLILAGSPQGYCIVGTAKGLNFFGEYEVVHVYSSREKQIHNNGLSCSDGYWTFSN